VKVEVWGWIGAPRGSPEACLLSEPLKENHEQQCNEVNEENDLGEEWERLAEKRVKARSRIRMIHKSPDQVKCTLLWITSGENHL